ncbi:MAG: cell division protein FtsH, partial [Desulfurivibrio sp.]|nr:cell division protein FtsH [Desulfurivibrio sp.]MBU4119058.1 cell division protein FtsH [Pseudomonadota bacterium]
MEKKFQFSLSYLFIALAIFILLQNWLSPKINNVSYSQFKSYVAEKKINSVVISSTLLKGYEKVETDMKEPMFPKALHVTPRIDDRNLVDFLEKHGVDI